MGIAWLPKGCPDADFPRVFTETEIMFGFYQVLPCVHNFSNFYFVIFFGFSSGIPLGPYTTHPFTCIIV